MSNVQSESVRVPTSNDEPMEAWQRVWRTGMLPQLSVRGLQSLRKALEEDSPRLITGQTMLPPPLSFNEREPVSCCCPLSMALLDGACFPAATCGWLDESFARTCVRCDELCGEPASCRYFLNWVDATDRATMREQLIAEIDRALPDHVQETPPQSPLEKMLWESIRWENEKKAQRLARLAEMTKKARA